MPLRDQVHKCSDLRACDIFLLLSQILCEVGVTVLHDRLDGEGFLEDLLVPELEEGVHQCDDIRHVASVHLLLRLLDQLREEVFNLLKVPLQVLNALHELRVSTVSEAADQQVHLLDL